jgi:hypothetical protein
LENYNHKEIWDKIIEMKNKKQTSEYMYWKMTRRARKEVKNKHPGLIISKERFITGKKNIANAFAGTYRSVYEGKYHDAQTFRKLNKYNKTYTCIKNAQFNEFPPSRHEYFFRRYWTCLYNIR